jgi:drug/metabolite transporter (DMT)-like permease
MGLKKQYLADLALLGVAFVWGTTFQLVKDALADIDAYPFLAVRFLIAFLFLLPLWRGGWRCHPAAFRAGCYLFGGYAFQTIGLIWTTPGKAAFITGLSVILVPFLAAVRERKLPAWGACCGALLAASGLGFLTLEGAFLPGKGDLLVFCCAVFFALQILAVKEAAKTMRASNLTLIQLGMVSLLSFGIWAVDGGGVRWSPAVLWALGVTSIPATAAAFLAQSWAQRFTSPDRVAVILAMEPVFAGVFSYFFGSEAFGPQKILGCALILAGIIVSELAGNATEEKASAAGKAAEGKGLSGG